MDSLERITVLLGGLMLTSASRQHVEHPDGARPALYYSGSLLPRLCDPTSLRLFMNNPG